jgi:hypothetical protein
MSDAPKQIDARTLTPQQYAALKASVISGRDVPASDSIDMRGLSDAEYRQAKADYLKSLVGG